MEDDMDDKLNALDKLIEAVEAGNELVSRYLPPEYEALMPKFYLAMRGSLDAARSLHEALLPGYNRDVDATDPECGIKVSIWSPSGPIVGVGDEECESRAWLLAILRAYRSLQA